MTGRRSHFNNPLAGYQPEYHQGDYAQGGGIGDPDEEYRRICATIAVEDVEKARDLDNFPDSNVLEDFLRWKQINVGTSSYEYWSNVLPSKEDRQNLKPIYGAVFYDQLVNFIDAKIDVAQSEHYRASGDNKLLLTQILNNYRHYISKKSETFQASLAAYGYPEKSNDLFRLNGLNLDIGGQIYDLTDRHLPKVGFLSNIISGDKSSVRYYTPALLKAYLAGGGAPFHCCIYLNPQINQAVRVAEELIGEFEEAGLAIRADIFNRAIDAGGHHILDTNSWGIAIFSDKLQTGKILDATLRCYKRNYSLFAQRPTPKLAVQVADGVAIATQEGFDQERYSFNEHRVQVFDKAWDDFKFYQMSPSSVTPHDIAMFKQLLEQECRLNQIDLQNISFPDRMVFRR